MRTTTLALPLALLAACVSSERQLQTGKDDVQEAAMSDPGFCVPHSSIKSIEPLDDRRIVLYEAGERKA